MARRPVSSGQMKVAEHLCWVYLCWRCQRIGSSSIRGSSSSSLATLNSQLLLSQNCRQRSGMGIVGLGVKKD